jgi:cytochrome c553
VQFTMAMRGFGLSAALLAGCSRAEPSLEAGQMLYEANGCASCHGLAGHGDGPAAPTLPAKPIDLQDTAQYKRGADEAAIAKTLAEGVYVAHSAALTPQQVGALIGAGYTPQQISDATATSDLHSTHHQLLMPKFDHLTELERRSIAVYLISMRIASNKGRTKP